MKVPQTTYNVPLAGPAGIRKQPVTLAAQSVAQFGETLFRIGMDLAEKQKRAREVSQYSSAKVGIISDFNDFRIELAKDMDYASHEHKANKRLKEIYNSRSGEVTEPGVKDTLKQWFDEKSIGLLFDVRTEAYRMEREYMQVKLGEELAVAEKTLDKELAGELLAGAQAAGIIFPDDAERERIRIGHSIDYAEAQLGVMQNGIPWLYSKDAPDLSLNEREEIQKWHEEKMKVIEDALKKEREAEVKAINEDLVNRFAALLRGEGTPRDFIDYVNQTTLDPTGPYSKQWWNENSMKLVEEPKGRYEITDPEIEAKVAQYVRRTDRTTEQKANYIEKYHGKGLGTPKYNKYMDKIGYPEKEKTAGKGPSEISNPELEVEITRDIADPKKDKLETAKKIFENIGADDEGNPRLDPTTAKTLLNWNESYKNDPAFNTAVKMFEKAFDDGYITSKQMVSGMKDFEIKASSGKYTTPGLVQESENMIALMNEEYIANKLERYREPGELFKHKETVEEYIARHPPETKTLPSFEEGNITDFATWKNVPDWWISVKTIYLDSGIEAHTDDNGLTWYMKIKGKWYVADPKANTLVPYKKGR